MQKSLLQLARETVTIRRGRKDLSEQELEVVQAWLDDEITLTQVQRIMTSHKSNVYTFLATGCKQLYKGGK